MPNNETSTKRIFVSYAHADADWCALFKSMLKAVHDPLEYDVWIDEAKIRVGDLWNDSIDQGLREADAALLLISADFLSSDFIRDFELPKLLARRNRGMPVVPVLVGPCPWNQIAWIKQSELRPKGGVPPSGREGPKTGKAATMASAVVDELTNLLKQETAPFARNHDRSPARDMAMRLIARVLLRAQDEDAGGRLARRLVERIAEVSGLTGPALFMAARVFIEFHLLRADEPFAPQVLLDSLDQATSHRTARPLLDALKGGAATGDYSKIPIKVNSMFFMLAREREEHWQHYFEALRDADVGGLAEEEIGTAANVDVQWGFLAPQHLLAGLMSRFNEDWRPILGVYRQSLPTEGARDGGFANLQASQWNCWLVWGPSVPICSCAQWEGHYAFQYGYGDENNSLPLLDGAAAAGESALDRLAREVMAQGAGAGVAKLAGRLRWGPFRLRASQAAGGHEEGPATGDDDPDLDDDEPSAPARTSTRKLLLADAQSALLCGDSLAQSDQSDSLLLELTSLQPSDMPRAYFSAYLWMMFLVTTGADDPDGPKLLWGRRYPTWPDRTALRSQQLWRHLLPVFVHANIADPAALRFQRSTLIESSLATLRNIWESRADNFHADDLRAGIRFHLVCASDYSGCGEAVRFPPNQSLCDLMRKRLARETDADFARSVALPDPAETMSTRSEGLAAYFSSCHLNEMIADYFDHVAQLKDEKPRARR